MNTFFQIFSPLIMLVSAVCWQLFCQRINLERLRNQDELIAKLRDHNKCISQDLAWLLQQNQMLQERLGKLEATWKHAALCVECDQPNPIDDGDYICKECRSAK